MSTDSTEPPDGGNPFPAINETMIGAGLAKTSRATELHRSLKVGRDFSSWIKGRLKRYGFVENVDYVTEEILSSPDLGSSSSHGGARPQGRIEYHLTLDTAKEVAMVENNAQGRSVRRYYIECERRAQDGVFSADAMALLRRADGIARQLSGRLARMQTDVDILSAKNPVPALDFANTVSAYLMIEMAGVTKADRQRGTAQMVTNRMLAFCAKHQIACLRTPATVNPAEPYRFPHALACAWLLGEDRGLELIRAQVDRAKAKKARNGRATGQAALALVPPTNLEARP